MRSAGLYKFGRFFGGCCCCRCPDSPASAVPFTSNHVTSQSNSASTAEDFPFPLPFNCDQDRHEHAKITAELSQWVSLEDVDAKDKGLDAKGALDEQCSEGCEIRELCLFEGTNVVQWALVEQGDTAYVVFKQTSTVLDAIIDAGAIPSTDSFKELGLRCHSTMWSSLQYDQSTGKELGQSTTEKIQEALTKHCDDKKVVLCGHSLGEHALIDAATDTSCLVAGGGYAILCALELLHKNFTGDITAVIGHGAPQVIVPNYESPLWQQLNDITRVYVREWDLVPRLPSCKSWIDAILNTSKSIGPFKLKLSASSQEKLRKVVQENMGVMQHYRQVGRVVFVNVGENKELVVPSYDASDRVDPGHLCHDILSTTPPSIVGLSKMMKEHHMKPPYKDATAKFDRCLRRDETEVTCL